MRKEGENKKSCLFLGVGIEKVRLVNAMLGLMGADDNFISSLSLQLLNHPWPGREF
jgi:hypothetical protein